MNEVIQNDKFVEIIYKVIDQDSGQVLTEIEFPLGYVHGRNEVLAPHVLERLEGRAKGEVIEVAIPSDRLFGPRDEALVFTDLIENVPEEYREVGTTIAMENDKGDVRNFVVTRMDDKTLTVDGNNPLCGRDVVFKLEVLSVRDATEKEKEAGGAVTDEIDIDNKFALPI